MPNKSATRASGPEHGPGRYISRNSRPIFTWMCRTSIFLYVRLVFSRMDPYAKPYYHYLIYLIIKAIRNKTPLFKHINWLYVEIWLHLLFVYDLISAIHLHGAIMCHNVKSIVLICQFQKLNENIKRLSSVDREKIYFFRKRSFFPSLSFSVYKGSIVVFPLYIVFLLSRSNLWFGFNGENAIKTGFAFSF